jgi:predicted Zn-dependent protease
MLRFLLFVLFCFGLAWPVQAQGISLLMDAEIQDWMEDLTAPLVKGTPLADQNVSLHIILDPEVNAFAIPGRQIFLHSGLIEKAETVEEVRGVLAHELGHVLAQHHIQRANDVSGIYKSTLAGALVGLGALLAGSGELAQAAVLGGYSAGTGNFLQRTRTQEREADQYAIRLLHENGYSVKGLTEFFRKLNNDMLLSYRKPPAHLITHPLPAERLDNLKDEASQESDNFLLAEPEEVNRFSRIQAKVYALSRSPAQTLRFYRGKTTADRLAQSIAYLFQGKISHARDIAQSLLDENPDDPYLYELMGHIALEDGNLPAAADFYNRSLAQRPEQPLIRFHYARTLQAQQKHKEALTQLETTRNAMPRWPAVWYAMGISYGQTGYMAQSHLSLAEYNLLRGELPAVKQQLALAKPYLKGDEPLQADYNAIATALQEAENP